MEANCWCAMTLLSKLNNPNYSGDYYLAHFDNVYNRQGKGTNANNWVIFNIPMPSGYSAVPGTDIVQFHDITMDIATPVESGYGYCGQVKVNPNTVCDIYLGRYYTNSTAFGGFNDTVWPAGRYRLAFNMIVKAV